MRTLLMESSPGAAAEARAALLAAGHEVVECHEPDGTTFPCHGVAAGEVCPLHAARPVDVALTVRAPGDWAVAPTEAGVSCALRHHVPVVVQAVEDLSPFDGWATPVGPSGVVASCELAIEEGTRQITDPLAAFVSDMAARAGAPAAVEVRIERDDRRGLVTVSIPEHPDLHDSTVATRTHGWLRDNGYDDLFDSLGVAVERRP